MLSSFYFLPNWHTCTHYSLTHVLNGSNTHCIRFRQVGSEDTDESHAEAKQKQCRDVNGAILSNSIAQTGDEDAGANEHEEKGGHGEKVFRTRMAGPEIQQFELIGLSQLGVKSRAAS